MATRSFAARQRSRRDRIAADLAGDVEIAESYFGWNAALFPGRGEHNLVRARGQWSLHQALVATRAARAAMLAAG